jgi:hypothetical protein
MGPEYSDPHFDPRTGRTMRIHCPTGRTMRIHCPSGSIQTEVTAEKKRLEIHLD